MRLVKFRIVNSKSIRDSGDCYLASDITVLAGRNESGKTAILEALRDFDTQIERLSESSLPLMPDDSRLPQVVCQFSMTEGELTKIASQARVELDVLTRKKLVLAGIAATKMFDGSYRISSEAASLIDQQRTLLNAKTVSKLREMVAKARTLQVPGTPPDFSKEASRIQTSARQFAAAIAEHGSQIEEGQKRRRLMKMAESISETADQIQRGSASQSFLQAFVEFIPKVVFFSDFIDLLPFELTFKEALSHPTVLDFAKVAELDLHQVAKTQDLQRRRNLLSQHAAHISGDFLSYWAQHQLELVAEPDGDQLRLGVRESKDTIVFKTEQRSKGFQWFLSFYLRLSAQRGGAKLILIDEPGLYLHAKAQRDVLKVLERISQESQIIFSTHSPFLIDPARLDRVRLVVKEKAGTRIENKVHKGADIETLTPIIAAIGLDVSRSFAIPGPRNALVEGMSDYFYIQAMREYAPKFRAPDVSIVPCVGAHKIPILASLLIGWGLDFVAILDTDSEAHLVAKDLVGKLSVDPGRVVRISSSEGLSIEDLFSKEDFHKIVLVSKPDEATRGRGPTNSRYLKEREMDKVLIAKKFLERVKGRKQRPRLSAETLAAFRDLFARVLKAFEPTAQ